MAGRMFSQSVIKRAKNVTRFRTLPQSSYRSNSSTGSEDVKPVEEVPTERRSLKHNFGSFRVPKKGFVMPKPVPLDHEVETHVTVLENGMRVASQKKATPFATLGVLADSGSRYESRYPSGVSQFLEKLSFRSTTKFQDQDIAENLEKYCGFSDGKCSREILVKAMILMSTPDSIDTGIDILSDSVLRPLVTDEELENARDLISAELDFMQHDPNQDIMLTEMVHQAAYRDNTLGLPQICPVENINKIDKKVLYTFQKHYHTPDRLVLAGVGVDHEVLVEAARKHFLGKQPIWDEDPSLIDDSLGKDSSISQYTGGIVTKEQDLSQVHQGIDPLPEQSHIVIGFESCSHMLGTDFLPFMVLQTMMGGGGSFSSGGPGKGMYSRLYTNVLYRHNISSAIANNFPANDSGIFTIFASSEPDNLRNTVEVIMKEYARMKDDIYTEELARAKKQLQSSMLVNLESNPIAFEDVGRQVMAYGERKPPQFWLDQIDKVTDEDIHRIAHTMLTKNPSVAALGKLHKLPKYGQIQEGVAKGKGLGSSIFSMSGRGYKTET